jgi:hypothetical protein
MPTQNYIVADKTEAKKLNNSARKSLETASETIQRALVNGARFVNEKDKKGESVGNLEILSHLIRPMGDTQQRQMMGSWVKSNIGAVWDTETNGFKGKCKEFRALEIDWSNPDDLELKALIGKRWDHKRAEVSKANVDLVADLNRVAKRVEKNPDVAQKQSIEGELAAHRIAELFKAKRLAVAKAKKAA